MKKVLSLILAAAMIFMLVACGSSGGTTSGGTTSGSTTSGSTTSGGTTSGGDTGGSNQQTDDTQSSGGSTEPNVITVTNVLFDDSPENIALAAFKEEIETRSEGRMTVEIYANGIMGGEMDNVENVRNNNVTMTMASTSVLANFVPECEIFDMPFIFPDVPTGTKVLQDEAVHSVLVKAFDVAGFHYIGANTADYRWLTCKKEVNSLADLAGMKIRVMENQNHVALWKALGANPTAMAGGGQLFTALQQGTVDAQENPVAQVNNGKFYEVQSYVVDTRHIMNVSGWIVSPAWYNSLSDADRAIFDEAAANFISYACELGYNRVGKDLAACVEGGMTHIPLSDEIRAEFKAAVGDTVENMIRSDIGDELVDVVKTTVEKYQ